MNQVSSPVIAQVNNAGLKNFIVGKLWATSKDGTRPGVLRINRTLPKDIILTAGTSMFLTANEKRDGKIDADYSVSVLLPIDTANELIAAEKLAASQRQAVMQAV